MYSEPLGNDVAWRDRIERVAQAMFVIACYLIVFAGLLYSVASSTGGP